MSTRRVIVPESQIPPLRLPSGPLLKPYRDRPIRAVLTTDLPSLMSYKPRSNP